MAQEETRCGMVAVVGAPNIGKSSLINRLIGDAVCSVSFKAQTTRSASVGVLTENDYQLILVDTPGVQLKHRHLLDREMNRCAARTLVGSDLAVFLVSSLGWEVTEDRILQSIKKEQIPCLLCINKVDLAKDKASLLAVLDQYSKKHDFLDLVPISVKNGTNLESLKKIIINQLPVAPFVYSEDATTGETWEFRVSEIIRTQLLVHLGQEIPHGAYVAVERIEQTKIGWHIDAMICVSKATAKPIVIGKSGTMIKKINIAARKGLEKLMDARVVLKLWVRVEGAWYNDQSTLEKLGIHH